MGVKSGCEICGPDKLMGWCHRGEEDSGDELGGLIWPALGGAEQSDPLVITRSWLQMFRISSLWGTFNSNILDTSVKLESWESFSKVS